jgi:hypothetical protein
VRKKIVVEALNPLHWNVNYLEELRDLSRKNRINSTESEKNIWEEVSPLLVKGGMAKPGWVKIHL